MDCVEEAARGYGDVRYRFDALAGIRLGRIPQPRECEDFLIVRVDVVRNLGLAVRLDLPLIKALGDDQAPLPAAPWASVARGGLYGLDPRVDGRILRRHAACEEWN